MARCHAGVCRPPPDPGRRPGGHPARGRNAPDRGGAPLGAGRGPGPREVRRAQPDRLLQGPWDDDGDLDGGQARRQGGHLREHRATRARAPRHTRRRPGWPAPFSSRTARSPWASSARRSPTAPPCCRSRATSTTASPWPASSPRVLPGRAGQLGQPGPDRGPEDGVLRDRRRARRRSRHPLPSRGERRKYHGLLEGLPRICCGTWPSGCAGRPGDEATPQMWGFQAAGAAPIVLGHPVDEPETIATAIRIGNPASWEQAVAAREESGGRIEAVTDAQILSAHRLLSAAEGIFVEPASAGERRRPAPGARGGGRARGRDDRLHGDRSRAEGPDWALTTASGVPGRAADPGRRRSARRGPWVWTGGPS